MKNSMKSLFQKMNACVKPGANEFQEKSSVDEVMATVKLNPSEPNTEGKVNSAWRAT